MKTNMYGEFYDAVIMQIVKPVTVDVSSADYTAQKLNKNTAAIDENGEQKPFVICAKAEVTLKVETWKGEPITWTFAAGPYPMPLRKIFTNLGNTATIIQIGY